MLPILPLLLILLFPGASGPRVGMSLETGTSIERRMIAALVETVRQEAEREALASSVTPQAMPPFVPVPDEKPLLLGERDTTRDRDGPTA